MKIQRNAYSDISTLFQSFAIHLRAHNVLQTLGKLLRVFNQIFYSQNMLPEVVQ